VLLAITASLLGALIVWIVLGARGAQPPSPAADQVIRVGDTSVAVPPDWQAARRPDVVVPGLGGPIAVYDPFPGLSSHAVLALAPDGVPRALKDLMGPLGAGRPAQLAGLPALAYPRRPLAGDRIGELTVARSPSGVLVVACIGRTASWAAAAGCADQVGPARSGH
jgi:hypothetical protein